MLQDLGLEGRSDAANWKEMLYNDLLSDGPQRSEWAQKKIFDYLVREKERSRAGKINPHGDGIMNPHFWALDDQLKKLMGKDYDPTAMGGHSPYPPKSDKTKKFNTLIETSDLLERLGYPVK